MFVFLLSPKQTKKIWTCTERQTRRFTQLRRRGVWCNLSCPLPPPPWLLLFDSFQREKRKKNTRSSRPQSVSSSSSSLPAVRKGRLRVRGVRTPGKSTRNRRTGPRKKEGKRTRRSNPTQQTRERASEQKKRRVHAENERTRRRFFFARFEGKKEAKERERERRRRRDEARCCWLASAFLSYLWKLLVFLKERPQFGKEGNFRRADDRVGPNNFFLISAETHQVFVTRLHLNTRHQKKQKDTDR